MVKRSRRSFLKSASATVAAIAVSNGVAAWAQRTTVKMWSTYRDRRHLEAEAPVWKPAGQIAANAIILDPAALRQQMLGFGANTFCIRGWMLQQQQVIGRPDVQRPLQRKGVVVRHASQPTNMERSPHVSYSSLDQSRVSRSCFTKPRNDAA